MIASFVLDNGKWNRLRVMSVTGPPSTWWRWVQ